MREVPRALSELVAQLSPANRAALADALDRTREPIAVIGIGCRFPGAAGPDAFWRLLANGVDAVGDVPPDRFDLTDSFDADPARDGATYSRWGAFLDAVDGFDPHFFGIAPREAEGLDPQQRLLLEVAWEAIEHAGLDARRLGGSETGVFIGQSSNDYFQLGLRQQARLDAYTVTGATAAMAAGRIAYTWDLRGPALVIDTICSSSLVAVHLAVRSLRARECYMALAGGVNVIASPWGLIAGSRLGALSPTGRCSTFDAAADGFVRGEGCGVVVLKRLDDALDAGDDILAVIRGSAMNQDGRSNGLTAPNLAAQRALLVAALADARLAPADIDLIETHGTGTPLGDPIEIEALRSVFGGERTGAPLVIGSLKTNIGHLEAAAGVASLIKAVLAVAHAGVPPHLHLTRPNPRIGDMPFRIPTALAPWPGAGTRRAGVSAFGMSGTNAHVIIEAAPPVAAPAPAPGPAPGTLLLPVSARDAAALRELAAAYRDMLASTDVSPADVVYSAWLRRTHHRHRAAALGHDAASLARALDAIASGTPAPGALIGPDTGADAPHGPADSLRDESESAVAAMAALALRGKAITDRPGAAEEEAALLATIGRAYVAGVDIDGHMVAPPGRFVRLPSYPWQRQRYWLKDAPPPAARPFPGERREIATQPGLVVFEQVTGLDDLPFLADHRVQGRVVAPGAALASILFAAATAAGRAAADSPVLLRELRFEQFLGFEPGAERRLQTVVEGDSVSLASRAMSDDDVWTTHARARRADAASVTVGALEPLETVRARCATAVPVDSHHATFAALGIELGPRFRALREIRRGTGEALTVIELPTPEPDFAAESVLLDTCFRSLYHCVEHGDGTYVPLEIAELVRHAPLAAAGRLFCHAVSRHVGARSRTGDLQVRDAAGRLLLEARGVTAWRIADTDGARPTPTAAATAPPSAARYLYELVWRDAVRAAPDTADGGWILVGDGAGLAGPLAGALRARGGTVVVLPAPDPGDAGESTGALSTALDRLGATCRAVVHLAALDGGRGQPHEQALALCLDAVTVARVLDGPAAPRLYLVSRGAQQAETGDEVAPAQAALFGLTRSLAGERPRLRPTHLDLDAAADLTDELCAELCADDAERHVALRRGGRKVARLVRRPGPQDGAAAGFPVRADATYLITGGLGGLGLAVARRLAERGARHLALVGRSAPGPDATAAIEALRAGGVHVDVAAADVADEAAVRALLAELAPSRPPLGGIIHAAGVLDDAPLERQDAARIGRVFAPKAAGAWWLHRHTQGPAAPWLIFFSSASAVLESPGQAAYAATNAFLDGLARQLTHHGRAALSIGWGAWSGTGMAAARDAGVYRGMRLTPADALDLLDVLMAGDGGHTVAMDFDPATWRARFPDAARGPLLDELAAAPAPANVASPSSPGNDREGALRPDVMAVPAAERLERLTELVGAEVCHVLRLQPERLGPHTPLGDVGMDSIMALEISNRLGAAIGLSLPATLPFSAPTLTALVTHIAGELRLPEPEAASRPAAHAEDVDAIRGLDAAAAALALQHELDETERLLGGGEA